MKTAHAVAAWSLLVLLMVFCSMAIHFEHNLLFWNWRGFTPRTICWLAVYAAALVAMLGVAPFTRERAAVATMWILLALLVALGVDGLRPEHVEKPPKPRTPSPLLYREAHAAALSAPFVLVYLRRRWSRRMARMRPNN